MRKLEQILFCAALIVFPFQLGKHFWPEYAYVLGLRSDYLSPTLYVSDLFIISLAIVFLLRKFLYITANGLSNAFSYNHLFLLFLFFLPLSLGIVFAQNPYAGLYGFAKVIEYFFFGLYIASYKALSLTRIGYLLGFGIIFSTVLSFFQFQYQGSLGGLLYFFGERTFTSETPGIANASLAGKLALRPYATFPHPNVLAGYLLVSTLLCVYALYPFQTLFKKAYTLILVVFASIGVMLSMSRTSIIVGLLCVLMSIFLRRIQIGRIVGMGLALIVVLFLMSPLHYRFTQISFSDESVVVRGNLMESSVKIFKDSPLIGVGIKNYIPNLSLYQKPLFNTYHLQPVHNIYILLLVELGVFGFIAVIYFLYKISIRLMYIRDYQTMFLGLAFLAVGLIGLFDHYFITLQQGQLLLTLLIGLLGRRFGTIT